MHGAQAREIERMSSENAAVSPTTPAPPGRPSIPVTTRRKVRLFVAVTLYVLWTAFIAYLALGGKEAVVVSRPQILAAPLVVEAEVAEESGDLRSVRVMEVFRGKQLLDAVKKPDGEHPVLQVSGFDHSRGWKGPGLYILPVQPDGEAAFTLVPLPMSPGFPLHNRGEQTRPLIYPATPSVRRQTEEAVRLAPDAR